MKTIMTEIRQGSANYKAFIKGEPGRSCTGSTPEQAIGALVSAFPEAFDIKIEEVKEKDHTDSTQD